MAVKHNVDIALMILSLLAFFDDIAIAEFGC